MEQMDLLDIPEDVTCELCGNPLELDRIMNGCNICQDCEDLDNDEMMENILA